MTNLIQTKNQVTLKTVDDFYSKIRANLTLHMKTFLMIAKDLHLACKVLNKKEFLRLLKKLKLNKSTASKLNTILESAYTEYLIERNRLPQNWTTAYEISKLPKDNFEKIKDKIEIDTSASFIKSMLNTNRQNKLIKNCIKIEVNTEDKKIIRYVVQKITKIIKTTNYHLISSKNDYFKIANVSILKQPTIKVIN
jgi:preprotein translocase subunit Sec63